MYYLQHLHSHVPVHAVANAKLDRRWGAARRIRAFRGQCGNRNPPPGSTFCVPGLTPAQFDSFYGFDGRNWWEFKGRKLTRSGRPMKARAPSRRIPMFDFVQTPPTLPMFGATLVDV